MIGKIIIGVVVVIIILGLIGSGSHKTNTTQKKETTVGTQKVDLGKQAQDAYLKQIGYSSLAELNLDPQNLVGPKENEITRFEDNGGGQVEVNVQDSLTKTEARSIALSVLSSVSDVQGLKQIFVVGSNGMNGYANK